jgi:hypothetical protein
MTIKYRGQPIEGVKTVRGTIIQFVKENGVTRGFQKQAEADLLPGNDAFEDEVIFFKPTPKKFKGLEIPLSDECEQLGIGWFNPNAERR